MNNSIYNTLPNANHFDLGGNGSPFQPQMQNGNQNLTPAFSNQTFQTTPTIPQKRDHNGMPMSSGSPAPGQQSQQFSAAPTPYAHLQQPGSAQATPSPTMQNQQFRQPSQQPRMQNASPSPFPSQQPTGYGTQMSPAPRQNNGQPGNVQPNGAMANFNPQYGMAQNAQMQQSAQNQMNAQMQQKQYQMRLLQQQAALRQQNGGIVPPRTAGGQPGGMYNAAAAMQLGSQQMPNGQLGAQVQNVAMQQQAAKRKQFLQQCQSNTMQQGRQFNPNPVIGQKPVDLYQLFQVIVQFGGSTQVERTGQWPQVGAKLGFLGPGYENAGEQLKMIYLNSVLAYEQMWQRARQSQKMEQARQQAHQMAGYGPTAQASPTKTMQPPPQQAQMNQYTQAQQLQLAQQQMQQSQALQQPTPTPANASLPQNGVSTPQQTMGGLGTIHHRRSGSMRKGDGAAPVFPGSAVPSPGQKVQRSPSIKQETAGAVMKSEEPQSSNYMPLTKTIETDGGLDVAVLNELGTHIQRAMPQMPSVDEMGVIDTRAIALSLASGIHGEVRYALDALAIVSMDQRIMFDLEKCDDLTDVIMDCAEDQLDLLSDEAVEVSDAIDLPSYESILRDSKIEADTLQDVPAFGTQAYELERAADKLVAITTILRNFSFYEHNHRRLTTPSLISWLSNTIRLIGTRHMLLRTHLNTQDFYKDMIIFLSNITQSLELPSRDDALHLLHFLLAFAPQPSPSLTIDSGTSDSKPPTLRFPPFVPAIHRYLPPALDCLAKLLARQEPNRSLYRSLFQPTATFPSSSTPPLDLLTRAFALAISVLPDRSKAPPGNNTQLRIVEARKAYLTQGMLAADILSSLAPANDSQLARAWLESEDAWAGSLVSLASLLSVEPPPRAAPGKGGMMQQQQWDVDSFRLIATRALTMVRRLAERAGRIGMVENGHDNPVDGESEESDGKGRSWDGIPQGHAVIGALMLPNCDKVSLGLLCGLHEMAMRE